MQTTIDGAVYEQPFWTFAMFILSCPICHRDIYTGERVYFIPETGFKLCKECGLKSYTGKQLSLF